MELNDIRIQDLPAVLTPETLAKRHYPLVAAGPALCVRLVEVGYFYASTLLELGDERGIPKLADRLEVEVSLVRVLRNLLYHHRFTPVSTSKLPELSPPVRAALRAARYRSTREILTRLGDHAERDAAAEELSVDRSELETAVSAADLLRKPGIRYVKVRLFRAAGIRTLSELGQVDPPAFREQLRDLIQRTGVARAVPTAKEVASDTAWAAIYPVVATL
jgi:hypothetical protein